MSLSKATAVSGVGIRSREEHRDALLQDCQSQLERSFIEFLYAGSYKLPDRAQPLLSEYQSRPDFYYEDPATCVYVDGPYHLFPERHMRDKEVTARLEDGGYGVVRVTNRESWASEVANYGWIFGGGAG